MGRRFDRGVHLLLWAGMAARRNSYGTAGAVLPGVGSALRARLCRPGMARQAPFRSIGLGGWFGRLRSLFRGSRVDRILPHRTRRCSQPGGVGSVWRSGLSVANKQRGLADAAATMDHGALPALSLVGIGRVETSHRPVRPPDRSQLHGHLRRSRPFREPVLGRHLHPAPVVRCGVLGCGCPRPLAGGAEQQAAPRGRLARRSASGTGRRFSAACGTGGRDKTIVFARGHPKAAGARSAGGEVRSLQRAEMQTASGRDAEGDPGRYPGALGWVTSLPAPGRCGGRGAARGRASRRISSKPWPPLRCRAPAWGRTPRRAAGSPLA